MITPTAATVRPYEEADHDKVLALVGHEGVLDTPANSTLTVEDGDAFGCVTWTSPNPFGFGPPHLGGVNLTHIARHDLRDKLLLAVCDAAMGAGHTRGHARVLSAKVLARMQAVFILDSVTPVGRDTKTGGPAFWDIEFGLQVNRTILVGRLAT